MRKDNDEQLVIQQQIDYTFTNPKLLRQAFVRKSYSSENGGEDNEVLEFIGDKVLDFVVVRFLSEKFGNDLHKDDNIPIAFRTSVNYEEFHCEHSEGDLTKMKQRLVEKKTLAKRIDELGLAQYLIMGEGDKKNNVMEEDSVKEDLFEAIIGAIALDCNWNLKILYEKVLLMLCPDMFIDSGEETDYVGLIYEWEAMKYGLIPWFWYPNRRYTTTWYIPSEPNVIYQRPGGNVIGSVNYDRLKYTCRLKVLNDLPQFEAYGESKHEARKAVCELAYNYIKENGLLFGIKDEIENPSLEEAINQLEILANRGYFKIPEYTFNESHDENGNPIWHVECKIEGKEQFFSAEGSSKKKVKKEVAFMMLSSILGLDQER